MVSPTSAKPSSSPSAHAPVLTIESAAFCGRVDVFVVFVRTGLLGVGRSAVLGKCPASMSACVIW